MEHMLVSFFETRRVLASGRDVGDTNVTIKLPRGVYRVRLSGEGYEPSFRRVILTGTLPAAPRLVTFRMSVPTAPRVPAPMATARPTKPNRSPKAGG